MAQVKLLSFDLDDTLWSVRPVLLRAERALQDWLFSRYPDLAQWWTPKKLLALRNSLLAQRPELHHQISTLRIAVMETALTEYGLASTQAGTVANEAFELFLQVRHDVVLFEHVEETLRELSRSFRLAAITNGNADVFRLAIGNHFSYAVRAEQHDSSKPEPRLFLEAQRQAGVTSAEMIHIGDHVEHDIAAAQQLGIATVWANLNRDDWQGHRVPDAEIKHFSELPQVIARISR